MVARARRIAWTASARRDLDEAAAFVALDSPAAGRRLVTNALAAAESLSTLTERGSIICEIDAVLVRQLLVGRYRLLYTVTEQEATILGFVHGARDLQRSAGR